MSWLPRLNKCVDAWSLFRIKKKISEFFDAVEMLRKSALLRKKFAKKENQFLEVLLCWFCPVETLWKPFEQVQGARESKVGWMGKSRCQFFKKEVG